MLNEGAREASQWSGGDRRHIPQGSEAPRPAASPWVWMRNQTSRPVSKKVSYPTESCAEHVLRCGQGSPSGRHLLLPSPVPQSLQKRWRAVAGYQLVDEFPLRIVEPVDVLDVAPHVTTAPASVSNNMAVRMVNRAISAPLVFLISCSRSSAFGPTRFQVRRAASLRWPD